MKEDPNRAAFQVIALDLSLARDWSSNPSRTIAWRSCPHELKAKWARLQGQAPEALDGSSSSAGSVLLSLR